MKQKTVWFTTISALLGITLLVGCGTQNQNTGTPDQNKQNTSQSDPNNQTNTQQGQAPNQTAPTANKNNKYKEAPKMTIDPKKSYTATVKTTKGDFQIQLYANETPVTVNNFVFLARDHFYDGIRFHRIVKTFMIQTGDPLGTGTGGPGYEFNDELPPKHPYEPGVVAMANAGPNTNGSQFFIGTGDDVKSLNQSPNYTVFGKVISGMDVVQKIASVPVGVKNGEMSDPREEVTIQSIQIEEK
ncbi:peptidylprolyl isomerase [Effusibacillus dendaii]|uniref:Peptidyl-prolyl cis-trans isomerase n=1 Tax=Effusibacillus dendaii TaxID=2743772 RepID=A0A7I8D9G9_9BACL|nr:peptidylprolyl isomerase [Effusibacillus dendaii]BCJ86725.1 hypothetical protein skT53_17100 [Effusibacillus dendaii]